MIQFEMKYYIELGTCALTKRVFYFPLFYSSREKLVAVEQKKIFKIMYLIQSSSAGIFGL